MRIRLIFRSLFQRKRVDDELDEELQYHLERQMGEDLSAGLTSEEAKYAAKRSMGAITQSKEECRDMRRVNFIDDFSRDLQYAARAMRRSPGFAALAVLIMALGIGANTAVFSVVNAVLLRPLAFNNPDRIVTLTTHRTGDMEAISGNIAIPDFQDWHDQNGAFEARLSTAPAKFP